MFQRILAYRSKVGFSLGVVSDFFGSDNKAAGFLCSSFNFSALYQNSFCHGLPLQCVGTPQYSGRIFINDHRVFMGHAYECRTKLVLIVLNQFHVLGFKIDKAAVSIFIRLLYCNRK